MPSRKPSGKAAALRRQGVLNRKPEVVQDELFLNHSFFDAQDLIQVKYEMVRRVEKDSWAVNKAAATYGFSRPAFYAAQEALKTHGLSGLVPKKRGPRGAHKLTDDVLAFVDELRGQDPNMTVVSVLKEILRKFGFCVHRRSLERALERRGKGRP